MNIEEDYLRLLAPHVTGEPAARLARFAMLLERWAPRHNLVRFSSRRELVDRHILDALASELRLNPAVKKKKEGKRSKSKKRKAKKKHGKAKKKKKHKAAVKKKAAKKAEPEAPAAPPPPEGSDVEAEPEQALAVALELAQNGTSAAD